MIVSLPWFYLHSMRKICCKHCFKTSIKKNIYESDFIKKIIHGSDFIKDFIYETDFIEKIIRESNFIYSIVLNFPN